MEGSFGQSVSAGSRLNNELVHLRVKAQVYFYGGNDMGLRVEQKFVYVVSGDAYDLEKLERSVRGRCPNAMIEWCDSGEHLMYTKQQAAIQISAGRRELSSSVFLDMCPIGLTAILTYWVDGEEVELVKKAGSSRFCKNSPTDPGGYELFQIAESKFLFFAGDYGIPDDIYEIEHQV